MEDVLTELNYNKNLKIINVVAVYPTKRISYITGIELSNIARAVPVPAVAMLKGSTLSTPHKWSLDIFERLGNVFILNKEE